MRTINIDLRLLVEELNSLAYLAQGESLHRKLWILGS